MSQQLPFKIRPFVWNLLSFLVLSEISIELRAQSSVPFSPDAAYLNQPGLQAVNAGAAYAQGITGAGVLVGDIGTGISLNNVAFSNSGIPSSNNVVVGGINIGTGVVGLGVNGSNIADQSAPFYHNTIVGGVIAARRNGGYMQGIAYNSNLVVGSNLGVPFSNPTPANDTLIANAINYVVSQGVKVINNSWGAIGSYESMSTSWPNMFTALEKASQKALIVFASGNNSTLNPTLPATLPTYSAAAARGGWIAVVATTNDGKSMARAVGSTSDVAGAGSPIQAYTSFCGYAASYCMSAPGGYAPGGPWGGTDANPNIFAYVLKNSPIADYGIVAPYGGINTAYYGDGGTYDTLNTGVNGTSFASAMVAGAGALVAQKFPWMSSSQLATTLLTTASHASNPNPIDGRGLLNVAAAMQGPGIFETTFVADTQGYSSTFGNNISGVGGLTKQGAGTLSISGQTTYSGATVIEGGALALVGNGSIPNSPIVNNSIFDITQSTSTAAVKPAVTIASYSQGSGGKLLMNFGSNPSTNQTLNVLGRVSLGGVLGLAASPGNYMAGTKYTLIHSDQSLSGAFNGFVSNLSAYTPLATKFSYDSQQAYLNFLNFTTASAQQSIVNTANALQGSVTLQNSVLVNSLSYDCNEFGERDICISVGGRSTALSNTNGLNNNSALLIGAYRPAESIRVGVYFDQNLSASNPGGTVQLSNNSPLVGAFLGLSEKDDGTGGELKLSAAYLQKNANISRSVYSGTEPGRGSTSLNGVGVQLRVKYGFGIGDSSTVSPYIGARYSENYIPGYSESISPTVQSPLTYQSISTSATTALGGLEMTHLLSAKTTLYGSLGVEQDISTSNGTYAASGINLNSFAFNPNPVYIRPTANLGLAYQLEKNQTVSFNLIYRQSAYQGVASTTGLINYTIGL